MRMRILYSNYIIIINSLLIILLNNINFINFIITIIKFNLIINLKY